MIELLGTLYFQVNTLKSLSLPIDIIYQYQCALRYFMESFQYHYVNLIYSSLTKELTPYEINQWSKSINSWQNPKMMLHVGQILVSKKWFGFILIISYLSIEINQVLTINFQLWCLLSNHLHSYNLKYLLDPENMMLLL